MAQHNKTCQVCGERGHSKFYCRKRVYRVKQVSDKQTEYNIWLEDVARPALITRDGNICNCCKRKPSYEAKLDIDHVIGKGTRPDLKRNLDNLQLLCRFPCHRNKTDNKQCQH